MGQIKEIADALDARIEDATLGLNLTCIKGYPAWDRPDISIPLAAIMLRADEPMPLPAGRVGKRLDGWRTEFDLVVYASNEVQLWTLVDSARTMFRQWAEATINSQRVKITPGRAERIAPPDDTVEQLRYAVMLVVAFEYAG